MTPSERILRELIAVPSVNPAFLPGDTEHTGEKRVGEYLAAVGGASGLSVEFREVLPGRSNLLLVMEPPEKARRRVVLAPHLDTVGHTEIVKRLFEPRRVGDRLYGRGACDTKGSIAAMVTALTAVARKGHRPKSTEIIFAGLIDEEHGQTGSRQLVKERFGADLAVVGEPTRLQVVTAHKGDVWLRLETRGKSAHGARPELGRNAVHEMARVVEVLETEYARVLKRGRHPLLGTGTINVGSIAGGTQPNVVPDRCVIEIDRRTLPGEREQDVVREIQFLLRRRGLRVRFANAKVARCRPLETRLDLPLVGQLMGVARQSRPVGVDFFCDAAVLAAGGIPSVVYGPGDIAQAHTADEWISLRSLERATAFYGEFLRSLP